MAEVWSSGSEMGNNDQQQDNSPADIDCQERRRRRRIAIAAAGGGSSSNSSRSPWITNEEDTVNVVAAAADAAVAQVADNVRVPVVGVMSVSGRSRDMEDTVTVETNLCKPEINSHQPVHFFGVFDGHGGPHVSAMCKEWMHLIFEEEVMRVGNITVPSASGGINTNPPPEVTRKASREMKDAWRRVLMTCFVRMDEVAIANSSRCDSPDKCSCAPNEVAVSGSTAVVVILTQEYIIVANCGDSRAILCRGGRSITLSIDHKADRDDERARIEAAGGRIIFNNGPRVEGVLAMSRSIGDQYLKPLVIPEPEIFFRRRNPEDECLILGSDGIWDVISNAMAGQVARECLSEDAPTGFPSGMPWRSAEWSDALFPTRSASAAGLLTRLALGKRSYDNISVIVVDLKRSQI